MSDFTTAPVHVRVPATSANLGPGFDSVGLALSLYDDVTAEVTAAGLEIEVVGTGSDFVVRDERHLVLRAMRAAFDVLGGQPPGLRLRCVNAIPHSRGLGSSAAAIVAGVRTAAALTVGGRDQLVAEAELALCAQIEGHPDNVAPCLLGGLTVSWYDGGGARAVRLDAHPDVRPVLCIPDTWSSTALARGTLPERVTHGDAAYNAGRAALLVAALTTRPDLLLAATSDRLHQPYRRAAAGPSAELMDRLRDNHIAAAISGAGPSVIVFGADEETVRAMAPARFAVSPLPVDTAGARSTVV